MGEAALHIAQLVRGTRSEGPGLRTAIWVQGCTIRCPGCCNPELFTSRGGAARAPRELLAACAGMDGLTVVGGEPMEQPAALAALLQARGGLSAWVFTGYRLEALRDRNCPHTDAVLACVDVVVDGPYDRTRPDRGRRWVGSTNQRVHFLTDRYTPEVLRGPRTVELRYADGELTVVGWPAWR